ncbi:hypothetical protein [Streptomyces sp. P17]|uniref:hypothetical protein n=1 Tax=Streptomyces sp. P17 TaxID=3074716 RepID=UPI0028F417C3|nr:hypothetical protein [Streptomyces sp. P17]MDT9699279.1 hypothetical protein [Streptomyces sp. P17]
MGCDEVLALLREREAACRREAERLRGEAERIAGLLVVCEQELARVATACQVVGELPAAHGEAGPGRGRIPAPRAEVSGTVGSQADEGTGEFTGRMLGVLAAYAGPVRCRQVVEGLGLEAVPREVERVRHQLKKAAAAGRVVQTPGGLFTLARGGAAARG